MLRNSIVKMKFLFCCTYYEILNIILPFIEHIKTVEFLITNYISMFISKKNNYRSCICSFRYE